MNVGEVRWREIGELMVWFLALSIGLVLGPWLYYSAQSIFLQLLLLGAAGGFWLLAAWRRRAPVSTALDAPIAAFLLVSALAACFSVDPGRSWRVIWYWACYVLFLYAAVAAFRRGWKPRVASRALLLVVVVLLIFAYYQLFRQITGWREVLSGLSPLPPTLLRVWGITDSPNTFGAIIGTTLPFALAYRRRVDGTGRIWPWLWLLLALPILLLTRSRGGMLAAGVGFILFWQRGLLVQLQRGELGGSAAFRRLGAVGLFLAAIVTAMILVRPGTVNLLRDSTLSNRFGYWGVAVDMAGAYPWTGAGPFTFSTYFMQQLPSNELITMPHNLFLSTLSMGGVVAVLVLLWLGIAAARAAWRADLAGWSDWAWAAFAALGALLVYAQLDIIVVRPALLYIMSLCGAILLASLPTRHNEAVASRRSLLLRVGWTGLWILLLVTGAGDWQASRWYAAGEQAMEAGDWSAATDAFVRGRSSGALDGTAFLYAEALSRGTLAFSEPAELEHAIANYEELLEAEPGWSANHANLAALYWQQGVRDRARAKMEDAIRLAPNVSLYRLNAGLWAAAAGDESAARASFQEAYLRGEAWGEAPLWSTELSGAIPAAPPANAPSELAMGNTALSAGDYAAAQTHFERAVADSPFDPQGYLGLGITAFLVGGDDAELLLAQASQLSANRSAVGRTWRYHSLIGVWQRVLEQHASPEVLATTLESSFNAPRKLRGGLANYPYLRPSLPVDMVPQLSCLTVSDTTARHLQLLRRHFAERGAQALVEQIDGLLRGDGRGIQSCGG